MPLTDYRPFGRSGLIVSPLALGTMTFGTSRWGTQEPESRAVFNTYVDAGGNLIDTANVYSNGRSEEMIGGFVSERSLRDKIIIATKAGFASGTGVYNGGNGAKHIHSALEGSLRRLKTDYVDLFWVHVWDSVTPAEELLETMTNLVRSGKIRYWGISNSPAWYVTKIVMLAFMQGIQGPIGLQYFYSLVNRDIENEFIPIAAEFGLAVQPWSPLAFGLLTGKYNRANVEASLARTDNLRGEQAFKDKLHTENDKRLDGSNPFGNTLFTEKNWKIVDALCRIADKAGESPARIALSWVIGRHKVTSTLIGVSRPEQVVDNIAALNVVLTPEDHVELNDISASDKQILYNLFTPKMRQHAVFGGSTVKAL